MTDSDAKKWGSKVIDCSVPGMGIEIPIPLVREDITEDGKRDVIVALECVTGNSGSFSHVTVLDGASPVDRPKILATLIAMPQAKDYRQAVKEGAKIRKISVKNSTIVIIADQWRHMDATACPSRKYVQIFAIKDGKISAQKASHLNVQDCA